MSLKHVILAGLSEKPQTGYELAKGMEGSIGLFWSATHQQIYRELGDLKKSGLVKFKEVLQDDKPDKKLYTLTRSGLDELKSWIAQETELAPNKSALLVKLFVGHLVEADLLIKEILRIRSLKTRELEQYRNIEKEHFKHPKNLNLEARFQYITLRRGIYDVEGWLAWANEVLALLKSRTRRQTRDNFLKSV